MMGYENRGSDGGDRGVMVRDCDCHNSRGGGRGHDGGKYY